MELGVGFWIVLDCMGRNDHDLYFGLASYCSAWTAFSRFGIPFPFIHIVILHSGFSGLYYIIRMSWVLSLMYQYEPGAHISSVYIE
jgi:hypothetical protein